MITWRGRGFIVPILALLAIAIPSEAKETGLMRLLQAASLVLAGTICWILGSRWNKGQNHYSAEAGKFHWKDIFEVGAHDASYISREYSSSHSFTLIKVQYWGIAFFVAALVFLVLGVINL